jgi:DNA-binding transcriptional ArsR family regulator
MMNEQDRKLVIRRLGQLRLKSVRMIVCELQRRGGVCPQRELATAAGVTSPTISNRLAAMERAELITKEGPAGGYTVRMAPFEVPALNPRTICEIEGVITVKPPPE